MADLNGFDANAVQPSSFDVLPAGEYDVVIVNSEMKKNSEGTGSYLNLELQVLSGPMQNRKIWDLLNLVNPNAKAVEIARGTLSAICRAVGVMTPKDSSELHNKPMRAKVVVTKSEEYGEQNKVKAYKPRQTGPATAVAPVAPAPAPAPAMAGASDAAPWG